MKKQLYWMLTFLLVVILSACGGQETSPVDLPAEEQNQVEDQAAPADSIEDSAEEEAMEPTEQEPVEESDSEEMAIDPAGIFAENCVGCHGADRSGNRGPSLLPERLSGDASQYANTITNGSGGMPSFSSKLSADEINALAEWILTEPE